GISSGMGGALSLLWHRTLGPIFTASLASYRPVEPNNMQAQPDGQDFCLTPRVETKLDGAWFSNIFDPAAVLRQEATPDGTACTATARLVDASQKDPSLGAATCQLRYGFTDAAVTVSAQVQCARPGAARFALV